MENTLKMINDILSDLKAPYTLSFEMVDDIGNGDSYYRVLRVPKNFPENQPRPFELKEFERRSAKSLVDYLDGVLRGLKLYRVLSLDSL